MKYITKQNLMKGNVIAGVVGVIAFLHSLLLQGTIDDLAAQAWLLNPLYTVLLIWEIVMIIGCGIALFYRKDKEKEYKVMFVAGIVLLVLLLQAKSTVTFICDAGDVSGFGSALSFYGEYSSLDIDEIQTGLIFLTLAYIGIIVFGVYVYRISKKAQMVSTKTEKVSEKTDAGL